MPVPLSIVQGWSMPLDVLNTIIQAKKAALKTRKRTKKTAAEAATEAVDIES